MRFLTKRLEEQDSMRLTEALYDYFIQSQLCVTAVQQISTIILYRLCNSYASPSMKASNMSSEAYQNVTLRYKPL